MAAGPQKQADSQPDPAVLLVRAVSIAHDVNNALVMLFSASEKLLDQMPSDHPWRNLANDVYSGTRNVARLVEQISLLGSK
jgi:hypothetical protein